MPDKIDNSDNHKDGKKTLDNTAEITLRVVNLNGSTTIGI
jgi:hypothetical protein